MISIRKAGASDCHFLASIILLAEDTGYEITAYTKMFNRSNDELLPIFEKMINNNTKGHPLTYSSYLIAQENETPAAAIAIYREGEFGDSNHLTTGALMTAFDRKTMMTAFGFLKKNVELGITKGVGTMQIDCVGTLPEFRGKGMLRQLIQEAERTASQSNISELQIQVWKKNEGAVNAYKKLGFSVADEKISSSEANNGKVLMTKKI